MDEVLKCVFCGGFAILKKDTMTIQKGIVKTSMSADSYQCTVCKRTFTTPEQNMESMTDFHHQSKLLNTAKDLRAGKIKAITNSNIKK